MITKLFELRDRGTFIKTMAVKLMSKNEAEAFLLASAGYGRNLEYSSQYVLFGNINGGVLNYDSYRWEDRTYRVAHNYVLENFDSMISGEVIDVEFILGETKEKCESERSTR